MKFIITSNKKDENNWSGKEFSTLPCKIYYSFDDCHQALSAYWFNDTIKFDDRMVVITPLTEVKVYNLLLKRKIQY